MSPTTELLVYGAAVPFGVAALVRLVLPRILPEDVARRFAAAAAVALGMLAGYVLSIPRGDLAPSRHWHWLPYLAIASAVLGPVGVAEGVRVFERRLLHLLLALLAAWFLVPSWASLKPSRGVHLGGLAGGLFVLMTGLDMLPARIRPGRTVPVALVVAAGTVAILTADSVSLAYGQLAGLSASALAGWAVISLAGDGETTVRALLPAYAVLVGGSAFVGFRDPDPPISGLLLAACAPLGLGVCALGPLARLRGAKAVAAHVAAVLVPIGIAVAMVMAGQAAGEEGPVQ